MTGFPMITVLTAVPFCVAVVRACLGGHKKSVAQGIALGFNFLSFLLAVVLWKNFDSSSPAIQFQEGGPHEWIPSIGAQYYVGIDGLGLLMVLLSAIIVPFALLASWNITEKANAYFALMLFMQAGLFGAFTA